MPRLLFIIAFVGIVLANAAAVTSAAEWHEVPDDGVIVAAGDYCLSRDLLVDREIGIEIKADKVTLDLRGNTLRFTGTPRPGVRGIAVADRTEVTIRNGAVGGFWYGVQCTKSQRVRVHDVRFDDIPYLAVNVAKSKEIAITDNTFTNFRYDLPKPPKSTYLIGVNASADDVLVVGNRFDARPPTNTGRGLALETVFILLRPGKGGVVAHNDMAASELLNRSYGVWVAGKADAAIVYNKVVNMQYGVAVAIDGSASVASNRFVVDAPPHGSIVLETIGISAPGPSALTETRNTFTGMTRDTSIGPAPATQKS